MRLSLGLGFSGVKAVNTYTSSGQWTRHTQVTPNFLNQGAQNEWEFDSFWFYEVNPQDSKPSYIIKFHEFGLNIPPTALITQIDVRFNVKVSNINHEVFVQLWRGTSLSPEPEGGINSDTFPVDEFVSTLWENMDFGFSETLTPARAADPEFGVGIYVEDCGTAYTTYIPGLLSEQPEGTVEIAVYYDL